MIATQLFGRSGHMSTRTIFGAAALSHVTQKEADNTLELLLHYGVNHIDVASSYGDAELRIAPWLARYRSQFYCSSSAAFLKLLT
jgi:aryl-alcohol dehydrogenase-like predicted oxidoreductase